MEREKKGGGGRIGGGNEGREEKWKDKKEALGAGGLVEEA